MSDRVRRTTEQRAGQCGAKIKYASQGSAEAMMTRTRRPFRPIRGKRLVAYQCPFCTFWHIGNSREEVSR